MDWEYFGVVVSNGTSRLKVMISKNTPEQPLVTCTKY